MHPFSSLLSFNIGGICIEKLFFLPHNLYKYLFLTRIRMIYNYNTTCPIWILSFDLSQTRNLLFLLLRAAKNEGIDSLGNVSTMMIVHIYTNATGLYLTITAVAASRSRR